MNKYSIKEKLWIIGGLIIILGGSLIGLFMLSTEELYFFSDLNQYAVGFLITGLIASIFGFLFSLICLDRCKEAEIKQDNTTKIRVMLTAVTILYLILIGYLMTIDYEWTVQPLIIEYFDPSLGFHYGFTISSYSALFATLLIWGIFVLPFVIAETGFLDDSPDEQAHNLEEEGYTTEEAEETFDRFVAFLKRRLGPMKKIKNYTLPIAMAFTILGSCLVGLPSFVFIDGPLTLDPKTETWFIKDYKGFIRGQLFLIGILLLVIGLILIIYYIRRRRHSVGKEILFSKR